LQGRYEEAEQFTRASEAAAAPDDVSSQCEWRAVRALICARTGQLDAAENLAREAVHLIAGTDYLDQHADALVGLAEILHLSDQAEAAETSAHKALELYERKDNAVSAGRVKALLEQLKTIST
jgi:tetratricopeptide (TPR) repeat protein